MKKLTVIALFLLAGCVDLGRVGAHPALKQAWLAGTPYEVADCLFSAALSQHLRLERDDPLSAETARYNLTDENDSKVAWVEVSTSSQNQSSVTFYHAREADVSAAISAMLAQCKDAGV